MRTFCKIGVILLLVLLQANSAFAHNGWIEANTPIIERGQQSYIKLLFGNHSDEHGSYRIDNNWDIEDSNVFVMIPTGVKQNITEHFYYMGELTDVDEERLGVNNYHKGSFRTVEEGVYILAAEGDFIYEDEEKPTLRSAKAFVAASKKPTMKKARKFKGFDQQVTPERAELVPFFNPTAVTQGEDVSAQLLLKGEPVANIEVAVIRRSDSLDSRLKTDDEGKITWTTGDADYYLIRAEIDEENHELADSDYEATMTIVVQR